MISLLLCSACLAGPTFKFKEKVSAHLGEIGPKQKNKMEIARSLMICRLLCSACRPTFAFDEKFCFRLTSKTRSQRDPSSADFLVLYLFPARQELNDMPSVVFCVCGRSDFQFWVWVVVFFFSVHLGEIRPEQKKKLELAKNLMICRLLCSASGPTFGFGEKFCFRLTSKARSQRDPSSAGFWFISFSSSPGA